MTTETEQITSTEQALAYSSLVFTEEQVRAQTLSKFKAGKSVFASTIIESLIDSNSDDRDDELSKLRESLTQRGGESKYQIIDDVAKGGMGSIKCVHDKDIGRQSVLKVILPNYKDDPNMIRTLMFEARITGLLEHPNIVSMHDIGFLPNFGVYFTMTYVHGESLLAIIDNLQADSSGYRDKYDLFELLNIFRKVCDAVAYAHSKNIIHRDIKPENIMVGQFGEVIVMDWGLAKKLDGFTEEYTVPLSGEEIPEGIEAPLATLAGSIKGTPMYLSPEQVSGDPKDVDEACDIFLLGGTLYHMFTSQAPFAGLTLLQIIKHARECDFPPPEEFIGKNENMSVELCKIINKAMRPDKGDRYGSVEALIRDIDDLLRGKMECNTQIFEPGEHLLGEGEVGKTCYFIVHGKVEIYKIIDGVRVNLAIVADGDVVGEMALITDALRTATAVALEETKVIVLSKEIFTHNLKKLPIWMEKAMTALALRLEAANQKFTQNLGADQETVDTQTQ